MTIPRQARRTLALTLLLTAAALPGPARGDDREVVVYSARHYGHEAAFEAFTRATGVRIRVLNGSAAELQSRLQAEGARTPADVLLTVDAGNLWNAASAGLLARVESATLQANIPAHLRDPEQRWFGLTVRARTIMYHRDRVQPSALHGYQSLAEPRWKGRLCLRPSSHVYNQSLLAAMLKRLGEAQTEAIVRGWVANAPVLINSDTKLLQAVAAGQCDVTIANHYYLARLVAKDPAFPVAPFWPPGGVHVNVSGAGLTAHARHRADALRLLEFLSSPQAQQQFADLNFEYPANPQAAVHPVVARFGAFTHEDVNLGAVGELQAAAVRLADRVGYR